MFPGKLPTVRFEKLEKEPAPVFCMNGLDRPFGEKHLFAEYDVRRGEDMPLSIVNSRYVKGKARIHGKNCLEVHETAGLWDADKPHEVVEFVRVTKTHLITLAAFEECRGVNTLLTFHDKEFFDHWAVGENNCGLEIELKKKGLIVCDATGALCLPEEKSGVYDLVDSWRVTIGEQVREGIRMVYVADAGQVSEFYYGSDGEELLRRYFVPDIWGYDDEKKTLYTQRWPWAPTLIFNGTTRVCVTVILFQQYV